VTLVFVGLFLIITIAVVIVAMVAYPHMREGSPVFTPEGQRMVRDARARARGLADSARTKAGLGPRTAAGRGRGRTGAVPGSGRGGSPDVPTPFPTGYVPTDPSRGSAGPAPHGQDGAGTRRRRAPRGAPGAREDAVRARGPAAVTGQRGTVPPPPVASPGGTDRVAGPPVPAGRGPVVPRPAVRDQDPVPDGIPAPGPAPEPDPDPEPVLERDLEPDRERGPEPGPAATDREGRRGADAVPGGAGRRRSLEGMPQLPTRQALYPGQGRAAYSGRGGTAAGEPDVPGTGTQDRTPRPDGPARARDGRDDPWSDLPDVGPVGTGAPESIDLSGVEDLPVARSAGGGRTAGPSGHRRSGRSLPGPSDAGREWSQMITSASPYPSPEVSTALPPDAVDAPARRPRNPRGPRDPGDGDDARDPQGWFGEG